MVKNTGGNKSKKIARKNVGGQSSAQEVRRVSDPSEMYAAVTKIYSSKRCDIIGTDGKPYVCTIRGKFIGRKRSDGALAVGTWIMVGFYDWEVRGDGSKGCDLLEIYTPNEKEKLKQLEFHNLAAIMNIGELEGAENEFTFSAFHQSTKEGAEKKEKEEESSDDEDNPYVKPVEVKSKPKAVAAASAAAVLPLAVHMEQFNKKETPNEQMDWLNINVQDI
jgi:hypothetical protein